MQHGLQIREVHTLIDDQTLDLVEHRRVGHVVVHAVHAARHDHRERQPPLAQFADLHRGGMGPQQPPVREIEGVVHRPRRVVGGDVERLEVVEVVLDLRTGRDLEP